MGPLILLLLALGCAAPRPARTPALPSPDSHPPAGPAAIPAPAPATALPTPPPAPPALTLAAVGDIRLDGPVGEVAAASGPAAPTAGVARWLKADLLFGNLECAVTRRGVKVEKKWNFRSDPKFLSTLTAAGFTLVNLANNHVMDYGPDGLADTLAGLDRLGILHVGGGRNLEAARAPVFLERNGVRVGFLGLTSTVPDSNWARAKRPGVAYSDFDRFPAWIAEAKKRCDVLIVSFHGGTELAEDPNGIQRAFGRAAIDAGADIVLGHHPHVIQPVEVYKGKAILYSLGNFLFVSPTPTTRYSLIARIGLNKGGVARVDLLPVDTGFGRIVPAPAEAAAGIRAALDRTGALEARPDLLGFGGT